jgi:transmembrane sensor
MARLEAQVERMSAEQASEWVDIMRNPGAPERAVFTHWLKQNERHASEYVLMEALDRCLDGIDPHRRHSVAGLLSTTGAVVELPGGRDAVAPSAGQPHRQRLAAVAAAAGLGFVAVTAWWLSPLSGQGWQEVDTAVGEQRTLTLQDGSMVHLNTHSRLRVKLSSQARELRLLSGEALFDVAPDPRRPFRVEAGEATIRALGTQFNVYRKPDGTEVAVLEGRVEVARTERLRASAAAPTVLSAGEKARVRSDSPVSRQTGIDLARAVAWQQRRLMFRLDDLKTIAAEFNRYNHTPKIRVAGAAAQGRRFSGVFDADRPQDFAHMVAGDDGLAVEHRGATILIRVR